jgi:propionyl-CoA carboxylase beta chain
MYVTGPNVVKAVTNEAVSHQELGGWQIHTMKSGVASLAFNNEIQCFQKVREFVNYLPLSNRHKVPVKPNPVSIDQESLNYIIPDDSSEPYDMNLIIKNVKSS